jgi:hypothetical protein
MSMHTIPIVKQRRLPSLQIVNHCNLAFASAHLIDANRMGRRHRRDAAAHTPELASPSWPHFSSSAYIGAHARQLNSRASTVTALESALVTRAHGCAQGSLPPAAPAARALHPPRAVAPFQRQLKQGQITTPPLFSDIVHFRCRHTLQRKSRFPSRPLYTSMESSVSSALVTVCAFKHNCFLIISVPGLFIFLGRKHEIS